MKKYSIELSEDELIILSDWLSHVIDHEGKNFRDQAEQRILWDLNCQLEKLNDFIFSPNYNNRLHAAYSRVRNQENAK